MPAPDATRALVLSGSGRFQDRWHPLPRTSARLAELLDAAGFSAEVDDDVERGLRSLGGVGLLVCNFCGTAEAGSDDEAGRQGLLDYLGRGGPVLGLHTAASNLPRVPEWETVLGAIWVRGTTMHPPLGVSEIQVHPERHAIVHGLHDFELIDERYTDLRLAADLVPLATHTLEGRQHPLLWTRQYGSARIVFDALGHDERSYDSAEHREILQRAARWLVAAGD